VTLLFALLTLAVVGVIAAVAMGMFTGGLEEPSTSLASRGLSEGPVTLQSLEAVRFSPALRGYRMEEVDAVLDRLGVELARRDREILQLSQELRLAERAYLQRAARGAASPDRAVPDTGWILKADSVPVTGSVPLNGKPDAGEGQPWAVDPQQEQQEPAPVEETYAGLDDRAGLDAADDGAEGSVGVGRSSPGYGRDGTPCLERVREPRTGEDGDRDG
jgi:DivIVA domain-containing protein